MSKYAKVVLVARKSCPQKKKTSFPNLPAPELSPHTHSVGVLANSRMASDETPDGDVEPWALSVIRGAGGGRLGSFPRISTLEVQLRLSFFLQAKTETAAGGRANRQMPVRYLLARFVKAFI